MRKAYLLATKAYFLSYFLICNMHICWHLKLTWWDVTYTYNIPYKVKKKKKK